MLSKKYIINRLFIALTVLVLPYSLYGQRQLFASEKIFSNKIFTDSVYCNFKGNTFFILTTSMVALHKVHSDTLSQFYEWTKYENGYSITFNYRQNGMPKGTNRYYELNYSKFEIFGVDCLGFFYQGNVFMFRLSKVENVEGEKVFFFSKI